MTRRVAIVILLAASSTCFAWDTGDPVPEKIAAIKAPFDMPQPKRPTFPDRTFNIADYGATACEHNVTPQVKSTDAIRKAIAACSKAGGGKVLIPRGDWITGAVHLKSNVNLHLEEGATLHFSGDPKDYLPVVHVRVEGVECYNYSPFVYAPNCESIAITGSGILDGHGKNFWGWKRKGGMNRTEAASRHLKERRYGKGAGQEGLRPNMIVPWKARGVLIEGVTIKDPAMWTINPVYCEDVIIRGITVHSRKGPNGDGIDLDSCRNVLIEYNDLQTNDDAVCLKSGLNEDGRNIGIPTENVVVRNFVAREVITGSGGIVFGSEMSGGVRNVYVHDALFDRCDRGIRFKSTRGRGGVVENIFIENVSMKRIRKEAFTINTGYSGGKKGGAPPLFRNISISNVTVEVCGTAIKVWGLKDMPVERLVLTDASFARAGRSIVNNARGVTFRNVRIQSGQPFRMQNVSDSEFINMDLGGVPPKIDSSCRNVTFANRRKEAPPKPVKPAVRPPKPAVPRPAAGERRAAQLYDMARRAERMGQREAAASLYAKIVKDYSDTSCAGRARERFDSLGK